MKSFKETDKNSLKILLLIIFLFILAICCSFYVAKDYEKYKYKKNEFISQQHYYNSDLTLKEKFRFFLKVMSSIGKN